MQSFELGNDTSALQGLSAAGPCSCFCECSCPCTCPCACSCSCTCPCACGSSCFVPPPPTQS
ncbi:MAG TPA: hypothetical protein EYN91_02305 [Candidatus Melainabacteria bacterium]|nr:hypothetical protein [Candidatus Melainabacteria bacterium]HIN65072.1 hypothetical protein [Candidatus Obscuribacterales bacterium]